MTKKTSSDTESDQLDWDPERIDDDGYPLVDENGSTLVPIPLEGPRPADGLGARISGSSKKLARFSHRT